MAEQADNPQGSQPEQDPALREAYARAKAAFTAADLQRYTELDEGIPFEQVLAELEEIVRQEKPKDN